MNKAAVKELLRKIRIEKRKYDIKCMHDYQHTYIIISYELYRYLLNNIDDFGGIFNIYAPSGGDTLYGLFVKTTDIPKYDYILGHYYKGD